VTGEPGDLGRFRVPSLRNARETGPYFHDGSVRDLADAVRLEAAFRAGRAVSEEEVARLVDFIRFGLMDKSRAPRRPEVVPSGLPVPLDGYRIPR
jgi:cytochrome c peroxidase